MGVATAFDALVTRIEEVLADGRGSARALAAADRFSIDYYDNRPADESSIDTQVKKLAWVCIDGIELLPGHSEISSRAEYNVRVRIEFVYFLGTEFRHSDPRSTLILAANDCHKVRAALGWGGNLEQTQAAAPTGLAGASLQMTGWNSPGVDPDAHSISATMTLVGRVVMTEPT